MSFALLFAVLMLFWFVSGFYFGGPGDWKSRTPNIILFILLLLLGWEVFGPLIHK